MDILLAGPLQSLNSFAAAFSYAESAQGTKTQAVAESGELILTIALAFKSGLEWKAPSQLPARSAAAQLLQSLYSLLTSYCTESSLLWERERQTTLVDSSSAGFPDMK